MAVPARGPPAGHRSSRGSRRGRAETLPPGCDRSGQLGVVVDAMTPRERKQQEVREAVAAAPEKSNRRIAREVGVDHHTVQTHREMSEKSGEVPHFSRREDPRTGRLTQPAHRNGSAPEASATNDGPDPGVEVGVGKPSLDDQVAAMMDEGHSQDAIAAATGDVQRRALGLVRRRQIGSREPICPGMRHAGWRAPPAMTLAAGATAARPWCAPGGRAAGARPRGRRSRGCAPPSPRRPPRPR